MTLPKAIQAQIDAADAIVEQMNGNVPAPDTQTQELELTPNPQPPEAHIPQVVNTPPQQEVEWKSRFDTLRGKYDAEVPRLSQQVRELNQAVQTLVEENSKLKQARTEVKNHLVTDADKETFGSDLVDFVDRAAKQATQPLQQEIERLQNERSQLNEQLGRVKTETEVSAQDRFQNGLARAVPDWETINANQNFLVWLGQVDPVFGVQRQAALDAAAAKLDANGAAAVFKAFIATQAPAPTNSRQELQSQVAPSRSRVAPVPATDDGGSTKVWHDTEIKQFYANQRKGYYDQAEADRIEEQINRAVTEGRVRT